MNSIAAPDWLKYSHDGIINVEMIFISVPFDWLDLYFHSIISTLKFEMLVGLLTKLLIISL